MSYRKVRWEESPRITCPKALEWIRLSKLYDLLMEPFTEKERVFKEYDRLSK